jgi:hypothetical protein
MRRVLVGEANDGLGMLLVIAPARAADVDTASWLDLCRSVDAISILIY